MSLKLPICFFIGIISLPTVLMGDPQDGDVAPSQKTSTWAYQCMAKLKNVIRTNVRELKDASVFQGEPFYSFNLGCKREDEFHHSLFVSSNQVYMAEIPSTHWRYLADDTQYRNVVVNFTDGMMNNFAAEIVFELTKSCYQPLAFTGKVQNKSKVMVAATQRLTAAQIALDMVPRITPLRQRVNSEVLRFPEVLIPLPPTGIGAYFTSPKPPSLLDHEKEDLKKIFLDWTSLCDPLLDYKSVQFIKGVNTDLEAIISKQEALYNE